MRSNHSCFPRTKHLCKMLMGLTHYGDIEKGGIYKFSDFVSNQRCSGCHDCRHQGCHRCFVKFMRADAVAAELMYQPRSWRQHRYGTYTFQSCEKLFSSEIYACSSSFHHQCLICFFLSEKLSPINSSSLKIYCCYFMWTADVWSVSNS